MTHPEYKYFDLQVNGYAGVDFNSLNLGNEEVELACKKLEEDNVEGILATLITEDFDHLLLKIQNLSQIISSNKYVASIIKGLHIEGPFLNPQEGFRGAHPKENIIPADLDKVKKLMDSGDGLIKLLTLAPESCDNFNVIKYLSDSGIIVSAGHSNASRDELSAAIDNGLKMFTHLGNGAPNILPRHDNIINRVLSYSDQLFICFIADGIHIPEFALNNYVKIVGADNCIIVTDAMAAASAPPGKYSVSHIEVEVGEDKIVREVGKDNLAGSAITMHESRKYLKQSLGLEESTLQKILHDNPIRLLKFDL